MYIYQITNLINNKIYIGQTNNIKKHSGMGRRGEKNGRAKLTEVDVLRIRNLHKNGIKNDEIYKMYPYLTPTSVRGIINGKTWTYLL